MFCLVLTPFLTNAEYLSVHKQENNTTITTINMVVLTQENIEEFNLKECYKQYSTTMKDKKRPTYSLSSKLKTLLQYNHFLYLDNFNHQLANSKRIN
jgi:hypothetical protein